MTGLRLSRLVALIFLSGACTGTHAMGACAHTDAPVLSLKITAGALPPESDRATLVSVYANGCAQVHRPAYLRESGDFRLTLEPKDVAALHARIDGAGLRHFDAPQVRARLGNVQKDHAQQRAAAGSEYFTVSDADLYEIAWADGKSRGSLTWAGLPSYAEAYPEIKALQDLNGMAAALQAVARRSDAVRIEGVSP